MQKKNKAHAYLMQPWAIAAEALDSIGAAVEASDDAPMFSVRSKSPDKILDVAVIKGVAIIPVKGALAKDHGWNSFYSSRQMSGYLGIRQQVEKALLMPGVRAILLDIDSPGGTVDGCVELVDYLNSISLPLYAWVDGQATSAAEWIKSTAIESYAPATAMHGSIGVRSGHTDWSAWNEKHGFKETHFVAPEGSYKATPNMDTPIDEKAREYIQNRLNSAYTIFRDSMAANLGLDSKAIDAMDAKIFITSEAIELGLVTGTMPDIDTCISHIAKKEGDMDKNTLKAEHPELYKQVVQEGVDQAKSETKATVKAAVENALSLMGVVAGEELANKVKVMTETNMTAEQAKALGIVPAASTQAPKPGAEGEGEEEPAASTTMNAILKVLQQVTPGAVSGGGDEGGGSKSFDALVAAHMAANEGCTKATAIQAVAKANPDAHKTWLEGKQK